MTQWQRPFALGWYWFRRRQGAVQFLAWVCLFWVLPILWFVQLRRSTVGLAAATAFALLITTPFATALVTSMGESSHTAQQAETDQPNVTAFRTPAADAPPASERTPQQSSTPSVAPTRPAESPPEEAGAPEPTTAPPELSPDNRLVTSVVEIVDGDTIYLSDLDERLRLVGIDTPETRHPNRGVECYGREASSRLAELIPPGTRVRVEWDVERHDHYGRPLGYLYRADDELFVNERMLHDGYAQISTIPPNVAYQDQFLAAQRDAREAGRGLWSACGEDDGATAAAEPEPDDVGTSTGGVVISALEYDGPGWDVERGDSENVTLRNTSGTSVDVGQWSVSDSSGHIITIPAGYVIDSGSTLTIYSGPGGNTGAAYFAGRGQAIWNNSGGDTATLRDVGGGVIDTYSYDS